MADEMLRALARQAGMTVEAYEHRMYNDPEYCWLREWGDPDCGCPRCVARGPAIIESSPGRNSPRPEEIQKLLTYAHEQLTSASASGSSAKAVSDSRAPFWTARRVAAAAMCAGFACGWTVRR